MCVCVCVALPDLLLSTHMKKKFLFHFLFSCDITYDNNYTRRVSLNCRQSSQTSFSDSNQIQLNLTLLEVATVALSSRHPTARCLHKYQHPGQRGGGKRLVPLGGEVPREHPVVVVLVAVVARPAAAAAVGGRLRQVVGVLHGVGARVLGQGHHRQRGYGAATQHLVVVVVRGVQEAVGVVVVAGGQAAVRLETRLDGVVRIRRRRAGGTCDGYFLLASEAVP